jgi:hypothetical protein
MNDVHNASGGQPFDPIPFGLKPGSWADLGLYLLGGAGFFLLASLALGLALTRLGWITEEGPQGTVVVVLAASVNVVFLAGAMVVLGVRRGKVSWAMLGVNPPRWNRWYGVLAVGSAVALLLPRGLAALAVEVAIHGDLSSLQMREELFGSISLGWGSFFLTLLLVGVLAPIAEELYFRGLLYPWMRQRWGLWVSILLSSALFGLAHYDSLGVAVSAMMMGVLMAWLFERTGSFYIPAIMHIATNSLGVFALFGGMLLQDVYGVELDSLLVVFFGGS